MDVNNNTFLLEVMDKLSITHAQQYGHNSISDSIIHFLHYIPSYFINDIYIYKNILINNILNENDINLLKIWYIKSKNIKNKFLTILRLYKWKKAVTYGIETDLYLNNLDMFPNNQKIIILENNTKYNFRLSDLINCLQVCLNNSTGLFSKPTKLKNPHTNIPFSINNLYNIYFKILDSRFNIPLCINAFFKCEMSTSIFLYDYYPLLKEQTIINFSKSDNVWEKFEQILNLLYQYRKDINYITFADNLSLYIKISICKKLNTILLYYLKSKFSCNPLTKKEYKIKTKKNLIKYLHKHPNFDLIIGKEIIRIIPDEDRQNTDSSSNNITNRNRLGGPPLFPPPPPPYPPPPSPTPPPPPPQLHSPIFNETTNTNSFIQVNNTNDIINPFQSRNEIPRTPDNSSANIRYLINENFNLFR